MVFMFQVEHAYNVCTPAKPVLTSKTNVLIVQSHLNYRLTILVSRFVMHLVSPAQNLIQ